MQHDTDNSCLLLTYTHSIITLVQLIPMYHAEYILHTEKNLTNMK